MANTFGPVTLALTGLRTTTIGIAPTSLRFIIGAKNSSSTVIQSAHGAVDSSGFQSVLTWYGDSTGFQSTTSTSKCISVWERVSGTLTEVLSASFDSYTASGFKLNITTANSNYQVFIEAQN